ncbi:hypothetical protein VPNG_05683 [Cytospora leucostoma]|uniref:Uncharacterized protein n=1 Tax=Cytospora leucostoma TaxID=1230097 RepID=A0A423WZZ3_9PEZI|nr:hypothetical protein VPNG_05683 [Cytospora leucostoma]
MDALASDWTVTMRLPPTATLSPAHSEEDVNVDVAVEGFLTPFSNFSPIVAPQQPRLLL